METKRRCPHFNNNQNNDPHYGCYDCPFYEQESDSPHLCVSLIIENWKGYCEHTSQMPQEKMKPVCKACGSRDVTPNAYAEWNEVLQKWIYSHDEAYCENCYHTGGEDYSPVNNPTT